MLWTIDFNELIYKVVTQKTTGLQTWNLKPIIKY